MLLHPFQSLQTVLRKPTVWVGFLVLYACCFSTPSFAAKNAKLEKVSQLKTDIKSLESQLQDFQKEEGDLSRQLKNIEQSAADLHQKLSTVKKKISNSEKKLNRLKGEQSQLRKDSLAQQSVLAKQLDSAYRMGHQDQIKVLLNQQDPNLVSRMMRYYEYLNESRIAALKEYQTTLQELEQVQTNIQSTQSQLVQQQQALQAKAEQLSDSRHQREKLLSALTDKIANTDVRLTKDRQRLQLLVKRVKETLDKNDLNWQSQDFYQLKGRLNWPTAGKVVSQFGSKSHQGISNEGIVISAAAGRNVRAVHHGRVVFSDWLRGYGLLIIIDHGSGYMSLYGHNQILSKTVGDWVNVKEVIAEVGDTGGHQYAGLYFAIRHQGKPSNPKLWLAKTSG